MKRFLKAILKWAVRVILLVLIIGFVWGFIAYWISKNDCEHITANPTHPMKAILQCEYGVANLTLGEIEKPVPADNHVLLKVRAAALNPVDGHLLRGFLPYAARSRSAQTKRDSFWPGRGRSSRSGRQKC